MGPGIWFAMTNYTVHAIMYMYFFLTNFSSLRPILKAIAPMVTVIQIAQMGYGLFINGFAVWSYFAGEYCHIQDVAVYSAVIMYASYFVLFSQLFCESRRSKAAGRQTKEAAKDTKHSEVLPSKGATGKPQGSWR